MNQVRKLTILAVLIGLVGALLVMAPGAYGQVDRARLDLVLSDETGDAFLLIPDGSETPSDVQELNRSGCRLRTDNSLVTLTAGPDALAAEPGLKGHVIGVKTDGEGNGTPCSRINNGESESSAETLTIELNGWYADYAQLGLKFKFGASGTVEAFHPASSEAVAFDSFTCDVSDCGADSGDDRHGLTLTGALFNKVVIRAVAPADGSVSLLDVQGDPELDTYFELISDSTPPVISLTPPNPQELFRDSLYDELGAAVTDDSTFTLEIDTSDLPLDENGVLTEAGSFEVIYRATDAFGNTAAATRTVIVYDGELNCGNETFAVGDATTMQGVFKRLDNVDASTCVLKPYSLNVSDDEILGSILTFNPEDAANQDPQEAAYSGKISAPQKLASNATESFLDYDFDLDGAYTRMQWCTDATFETDGYVSWAMLPGDESWCIAAENSVTVGGGDILTTWTVYGLDDPAFYGR